jgi:hypothetical protein
MSREATLSLKIENYSWIYSSTTMLTVYRQACDENVEK